MIKIACWSGPRNISTALMRSWSSRNDVFVSDEPFYAHYLKETKLKHPMHKEIIDKYSSNYDEVVNYLTGEIPNNKKIWYQKHMAHHILPKDDLNWIKKINNCILIRHPNDVILSYINKFHLESSYQLGYKQQDDLYNYLKLHNISPIVIESKDLVCNPEIILNKLCNKLSIKFYKEMLFWPKGPRKTDGIWGKYWYDNVNSSQKFNHSLKQRQPVPELYKKIYSQSLHIYNRLFQFRLK